MRGDLGAPEFMIVRLMTVLLVFAAIMHNNDRAQAQAAPQLRGVDYAGDLPTLVADKAGLLGALGISVSYGNSGKNNLKALRAGEIDFALMAMTPFVIDRLADPTPNDPADPVILANLTHATPINHLVHLGNITDPDQLKGSRVGLPRGTNAEYLLWIILNARKIDVNDVTIVDLPMSSLARIIHEASARPGSRRA